MSADPVVVHPLEIAQPERLPARPAPSIWMDPNAFHQAREAAKVFAGSQMVPAHLRGKPDDCLIVLAMAHELGENPILLMQAVYMISGKPGWSASYMIARANQSGVFATRIGWRSEGAGATLSVTAYAVDRSTGEEVHATADMRMAKAEGWTKNAKYDSMPEHMLRWRSATMLIRLHAPEILYGYSTKDELEDVEAAQARPRRQVGPTATEPVATPEAAPAAKHHPSWTRDQKRFFALLAPIGVDYYDLAARLEAEGKPRPSQLTQAQRDDLIAALEREAQAQEAVGGITDAEAERIRRAEMDEAINVGGGE